MIDLTEWSQQEDTRQFFKQIEAKIIEIEQDIGRNQRTLTLDSLNATALKTPLEIGKIKGLQEMLDDYR